MAASVPDSPARRDPAWVGRVFWTCAALVILAPALVAAEFKPWVMLSPENLKVTARFIGDFLPPELDGEFLGYTPSSISVVPQAIRLVI